jgi:hypothetical protein
MGIALEMQSCQKDWDTDGPDLPDYPHHELAHAHDRRRRWGLGVGGVTLRRGRDRGYFLHSIQKA